MVNYYARRGDIHRARETFEKMRARGIEPTSHVYTKLVPLIFCGYSNILSLLPNMFLSWYLTEFID